MDDWGDPWADDAEKKSPLPQLPQLSIKGFGVGNTAHKTQASVLEGFEDEAQWGITGEEGSRGWEDSDFAEVRQEEEREEEDVRPTETAVTEEETAIEEREDALYHGDSVDSREEDSVKGREARSVTSSISNLDERHSAPVVSLDITVTENVNVAHSPKTGVPEGLSGAKVSGEEDDSTRPSTSPSELSHVDPGLDSARTSLEEYRFHTMEDKLEPETLSGQSISMQEEEKWAAHTTRDFESSEGRSDPDQQSTMASAQVHGHMREFSQSSATYKDNKSVTLPSSVDISLISKIWSIPLENKLPYPSESPISSTSTRKAWYRITRRDTLREFNSGKDVNSYARVTWSGSAVQAETNKIVSRWASENRIFGKASLGQRPSAMFGWDQQVQIPSASQTQSIVANRPSQDVPITSENRHSTEFTHHRTSSKDTAMANFAWSTSSPIDGRKSLDSGATFTWSSTVAPKIDHPTGVSSRRSSLSRPLSMAFDENEISASSVSKEPNGGNQDGMFSNSIPTAYKTPMDTNPWGPLSPLSEATLQSPPLNPPPYVSTHGSDGELVYKPDLPHLDPVPKKPPNTFQNTDDEDDWGDMVQSPSLPPPPSFPTQNTSTVPPRPSYFPSLDTTLSSATTPSAELGDPPLPTARPIVALSPTHTSPPPPTDNDDDDWGEMVQSPLEPPAPGFATPLKPFMPRSTSTSPFFTAPRPGPSSRNARTEVPGTEAGGGDEVGEVLRAVLEGLPDWGYMLK
ncbi:hypothetical protein M501DRAFT_534882 [Patellaria atrata CBS 101060]|uniref:Uncharacterized protein n=1 Tax=Patellaria atrata CBS 101060 TaxID=1346257 RepID=A0A9P4VRS8_9PEZI|nr:hypothetical protein M501DRAFT_534882 [Patellaria atrata CBS 101060]